MFTWKHVERMALVVTIFGAPLGLYQCYLAARAGPVTVISPVSNAQFASPSSNAVGVSTVVISQSVQPGLVSPANSSGVANADKSVTKPHDNYTGARLVVSGAANHVRVLTGDPDDLYEGGSVSGAGTEATIHLPVGQRLRIETMGSGADIEIERKLMRYVDVMGTGSGTNVTEI